MRSAEAILDLYRSRKGSYASVHQKMQMIADIYNGRATIPLPDMEREDTPNTPNLLTQGVDQMAGRITSVTPAATFASAKPGVRKFDRRAEDSGRAVTGWWQADRLPIKMKQRGRRLIAYSMAPVVMRWNYTDHRPTWQVRHPLETFPSPDLEPGKIVPDDCIFTFKRSVGWLQANGYGAHIHSLAGREDIERDSIVTLIEYIDGDHTVLMATGYFPNSGYYNSSWYDGDSNAMRGIVLEAYENIAGIMPVCVPVRLTLDTMTGQFDNMIGMYYQQAKLMALEVIAVEKGIFPDTYLESRAGEVAKFTEGPYDGRSGLVNVVQGGVIKEMQSSPGYLTNPTIDRIERAQRVTSGVPAEFGGESGSNIRTGRRGDAVLSAVIDYPVAEAQEMFAFALERENEIGIAMSKAIDGDTQRTIFVGTGNARRPVTYTPTETFETSEHVVSYPATGSDMNSLIIGIGQRVGLGTMSKRTAQVLDPYIENPEAEHDAIIAEGLEAALVSGLQSQAQSGQIPPLTLSKIMKLVRNDQMELAEALVFVAEQAAKEQAAAQSQPPDPSMPQTADQMSAGPTQSALAGVQPPQETMPGMNNLSQMLGSLRRPAMTIQPFRGAAKGAV